VAKSSPTFSKSILFAFLLPEFSALGLLMTSNFVMQVLMQGSFEKTALI
jgi:hypothetical protein